MRRPRERVNYSSGGGPVDVEPPARPVDGIPWLTGPQRDFLAHLTTLRIQAQLKPARSYARISEALGELAEAGQVELRADDENVWVFICGRWIVHCARDWLEWMTPQWAAAGSN
jgi:hypothetical protein